MHPNSHTTRACKTLILKRPDGSLLELKAKALSDRDISELDEWLREFYIKMVRGSLKDVSNSQYEIEMNIAHRTALSLTWLSGEGARLMGTVSGLARLTLQMVETPGLTFSELNDLMQDPENVSAANAVFNELNNSPYIKKKTGGNKKRLGKQNKRRKQNKQKRRK